MPVATKLVASSSMRSAGIHRLSSFSNCTFRRIFFFAVSTGGSPELGPNPGDKCRSFIAFLIRLASVFPRQRAFEEAWLTFCVWSLDFGVVRHDVHFVDLKTILRGVFGDENRFRYSRGGVDPRLPRVRYPDHRN